MTAELSKVPERFAYGAAARPFAEPHLPAGPGPDEGGGSPGTLEDAGCVPSCLVLLRSAVDRI